MNPNHKDNLVTSILPRLTLVSAALTTFFSVIVLIGWVTNVLRIVRISAKYIPMAPTTAFCFALLGAILIYRQWQPVNRRVRRVLCTFAGIVLFLSVVLLLQFALVSVTAFPLDIEQCIVPSSLSEQGYLIGRMSPLAAFLFILLSSATLFSFPSRDVDRGGNRVAQSAAVVVFVLAGILVVGYWYDAPLLYGGPVTPVAPTTAIGFVLLSGGFLFNNPNALLYRWVISTSVFSRFTRLVLPGTIGIILILGWAHLNFLKQVPRVYEVLYFCLSALFAAGLITLLTIVVARKVQEATTRAEQAVRVSENRFRQMFDNMSNCVAVYEAIADGDDFVIKDFNWAAEQVEGLNKKNVLGRSVLKVFPGVKEFGLFEVFQRVWKTGKPESHPVGLYKDNRISGWRENFVYKLPCGEVVAIYEDVTARKRAAEALRESEKRYRIFFEQGPDGVVILDPATTQPIEFNDQACRQLGYTRDEFSRLRLADIEAVETAEETNAHIQKILREGRDDFETQQRTKQGEIRNVYVTAQVIEIGGRSFYHCVWRDITERKQAEEALRESEALLNRVGQIAKIGGWEMDLITRKARWTRGTYDIVEIEPGDPIPGPDEHVEYYLPEYRSLVAEAIRALIEENKPLDFEAQLRTAKGNVKWCHAIGEAVREGEKCVKVHGTFQDITDHKKAEEAMRESEEKYRALIETTNTGYVIIDLAGTVLDANDEYARLSGHERRDEILGRSVVEWTAAYDKERNAKAVEECVRQGFVRNLEIDYVMTQGQTIPVETNATLVTTKSGPQILALCHDITERKKAEEALRERESQFKKLSYHVPGMIYQFMKRPDGTYCLPFATEAIKDIFGCSPQDVREDFSPIARVILPEDFDKLVGSIEYSAKHLTVWQCEYRVQISGQSIRWIFGQSTPEKLADGSVIWHGFNTDITERKRAEEETRRVAQENASIAEIGRIISSTLNIEEVYNRFVEKVRKLILFDRIGVNIIHPQGQSTTIAYVSGHDIPGRRNGDQYSLAGSLSGELTRTRSSLFFQTDDEKEWAERFPASLCLFRGGIRSLISIPLMARDQVIAILHFESLKSKTYTESDLRMAERVGNQIAGAIANAQLFAQHERSEAEKANLQAQLQQSQKMEAIGQLAGGVAHDFNNLLTVISVQAQLAVRGLREGDPLKEKLKDIEQAADRAGNLTRQLLAFSRRQILEMKVVNFNAILRDLEKMLFRVIGEDIELKTILADDLGMVKVDPGQMEQVIVNLAVNAKDAMPKGGKLSLETANAELDEGYVHSHAGMIPGAYILLSITDTGIGMTKEVQEQIFEPFFTTKEKGKGTGLGLSTVYGIVKQSGGDICVYSEPNKGTTFKVYLPRVFEPQEEFKKEAREEISRGTETILVVEDEDAVRRLAIDILRKQGYRVLEASEGGEALVRCEKEKDPIDLIVTDIVMPHMGGPELIERLRQVRKDFKVLYMTGYTDEKIVNHGILVDGINLIHKPFTLDKLARKVREVLDKNSESSV